MFPQAVAGVPVYLTIVTILVSPAVPTLAPSCFRFRRRVGVDLGVD